MQNPGNEWSASLFDPLPMKFGPRSASVKIVFLCFYALCSAQIGHLCTTGLHFSAGQIFLANHLAVILLKVPSFTMVSNAARHFSTVSSAVFRLNAR